MCNAGAVPDELPDFHIPHSEKIEWMIETNGWAIEAVPARHDLDPPFPGYSYTIGFEDAFGFPDVALFGLTPVASRGMFDLVASLLGGGTEIPLGVAVVGLLDNDLRCAFAPLDMARWGQLFTTAVSWQRRSRRPADGVSMVQLLWPDRDGWLPSEAGFDRRLRFAQPVIGSLASADDGAGATGAD